MTYKEKLAYIEGMPKIDTLLEGTFYWNVAPDSRKEGYQVLTFYSKRYLNSPLENPTVFNISTKATITDEIVKAVLDGYLDGYSSGKHSGRIQTQNQMKSALGIK